MLRNMKMLRKMKTAVEINNSFVQRCFSYIGSESGNCFKILELVKS